MLRLGVKNIHYIKLQEENLFSETVEACYSDNINASETRGQPSRLQTTYSLKGRGGGQVVSMPAFYSDNPSLNPT